MPQSDHDAPAPTRHGFDRIGHQTVDGLRDCSAVHGRHRVFDHLDFHRHHRTFRRERHGQRTQPGPKGRGLAFKPAVAGIIQQLRNNIRRPPAPADLRVDIPGKLCRADTASSHVIPRLLTPVKILLNCMMPPAQMAQAFEPFRGLLAHCSSCSSEVHARSDRVRPTSGPPPARAQSRRDAQQAQFHILQESHSAPAHFVQTPSPRHPSAARKISCPSRCRSPLRRSERTPVGQHSSHEHRDGVAAKLMLNRIEEAGESAPSRQGNRVGDLIRKIRVCAATQRSRQGLDRANLSAGQRAAFHP